MKKLIALLMFSVLIIGANAIAGTVDTAKMSKSAKKRAKMAADKTTDKAKETADKTKDKAKATTDVAKGKTKTTADQAKDAAGTEATAVKTKAKKSVTDVANKSADKAIGKDASGRTIYLGPKGGQYVLSSSGKKEYLPKDKKIVVQ
jgi:hypothetical protein